MKKLSNDEIIKLNVVMNLMCRTVDITNEDIEYLNQKYDNVRAIKKRYKNNDLVILVGDYFLDISNVDQSNCIRVAKLVTLAKFLSRNLEKALSNDTFRLSLPSKIMNSFRNSEFINIIENNEIIDALELISELIYKHIVDDLVELNKMQIGISDKNILDENIIEDIDTMIEGIRSVKDIDTDLQYNEFNDTYTHTESCYFTDELLDLLNKKEVVEYFCKYCNNELIFINNMTAYCEICDSTFILEKVDNELIDSKFYEGKDFEEDLEDMDEYDDF